MRMEDRGDAENVASATECTGLVPAFDGDEGDEALRELYAVQPAKRGKQSKAK